jgi:RNA polymerase-binding transcription factor DksA
MYLYRPASEDMSEAVRKAEDARDFWMQRAQNLEAMRREEFHERVEARLAYIEKKEREAAERRGKRVERMGFAICYTGAIIIFAMYVAKFMFG